MIARKAMEQQWAQTTQRMVRQVINQMTHRETENTVQKNEFYMKDYRKHTETEYTGFVTDRQFPVLSYKCYAYSSTLS